MPPDQPGILGWILGNSESLNTFAGHSDRFKAFRKQCQSDIFVAVAFFSKFVIVYDDDLIDFLAKDPLFIKMEEVRVLFEAAPHGLLTLEGHVHKKARQALIPFFSIENIKAIYPEMRTIALEFKSKLNTMKGPFDIMIPIQECTLDIICKVAFGYNLNSLTKTSVVTDAVATILKSFEYSIWLLLRLLLPALNRLPIPYNRDRNAGFQTISSVIDTIILQRLASATANQDILTRILAQVSTGDMPIRQLKDHMMTFLLAGHETTASTVTWACVILANHPHIQQALRDSISSLEFDSLMDNEYLDKFVNEVIRIYPAVPSISRENTKPFDFKGIHYPKGTKFYYSQVCHGDSTNDPRSFHIDRTFNFNGFWKGHRSCIGKQLAIVEVKLMLSVLVPHFHMQLKEPIVGHFKVVLRPDEVMMQLTPVK